MAIKVARLAVPIFIFFINETIAADFVASVTLIALTCTRDCALGVTWTIVVVETTSIP